MLKRNTLLFVLLLLFTFISFFFGSRVGIDPDFGWHIRVGDFILSHGIPHTDPFSYTMPSYPYVDHEWLQNVVMAYLYPRIGLYGLDFMYAVLAFLAVCIMVLPNKTKWLPLPFLLTGQALLFFLGVRPQIISWVFFAVLMWILIKESLWTRYRFFLPVFFVLWVNMHGSFPLGLVLVFMTLVTRAFLIKRLQIGDSIIFFLSILATFLNPYGLGVWWEVWMTMTDSMLKWKIIEWSPTFFAPIYGYLLLLPLSVLLVWRYKEQFPVLDLVLYLFLLLLGISTTRHAPFWLLLATPMTAVALGYFYDEVKANAISKRRFLLVHTWGVYTLWFVIGLLVLFTVWRSFTPETATYPIGAVAYLKTHPARGNIFAEYGWGGYLLWQMPDHKEFIDGRMPSWRRDSAPKGESLYAFNDQLTIMRGEPRTEKLLQQYHIEYVLLANADNTKLVEFAEQILHLSLPIPKRERLQQKLKALHFNEVYRDDVAIIYQKQTN